MYFPDLNKEEEEEEIDENENKEEENLFSRFCWSLTATYSCVF